MAVSDRPSNRTVTLSQALDQYHAALPSKRKTLEPGIFQRIIGFRSKLAKDMDEDECRDLELRICLHKFAGQLECFVPRWPLPYFGIRFGRPASRPVLK